MVKSINFMKDTKKKFEWTTQQYSAIQIASKYLIKYFDRMKMAQEIHAIKLSK